MDFLRIYRLSPITKFKPLSNQLRFLRLWKRFPVKPSIYSIPGDRDMARQVYNIGIKAPVEMPECYKLFQNTGAEFFIIHHVVELAEYVGCYD